MSIVISPHRRSSFDQTLCCIEVVQLKLCHLFISNCMKQGGIHITSLWFHRACCCRDKSSGWG